MSKKFDSLWTAPPGASEDGTRPSPPPPNILFTAGVNHDQKKKFPFLIV